MFFRKLLNVLFPTHCLGCHREGSLCCPECYKTIHTIHLKTHIKNCEYLDSVYIACCYDKAPIAKKLIHTLKYRGEKTEAPEILGRIAIETLKKHNILPKTLIPIPLHPKRLHERGFNQSELLAKEIQKQFPKFEINTHILKRVRNTLSQTKMKSKEERRKNLEEAFKTTKTAPKECILIDDVCTTGTTLNECAKALKENGAQSITALVIARNM